MTVRVGIVDSGINPDHAHVGRVAGGVNIQHDGEAADYIDRIGHGTAVAGVIREKAPDSELYAVRIFDRQLATTIGALMRGLEWCMERKLHIINVSVGTANQLHRARLQDFVDRAHANEVFVVSAADMLPGALPRAIGVTADDACPRDLCRFCDGVFSASPYPRSIPGVPLARNLNGVSFAIANFTGLLARALESQTPADAYEYVLGSAQRAV